MKRIFKNLKVSTIVSAIVILLCTLLFGTVPVSASASTGNELVKATSNIGTNSFSITLVAASGSSVEDKQLAQYICDGNADQVEIQKAIDSLPSQGGIVKLVKGTYYISGMITIYNGRDNITVTGMGADTLLKSVGNIHGLIRVRLSTNVVISNLSMDGSSQTKRQSGLGLIHGPYSSHLTISNIAAYNGGYYGISLWNANDALVEGCTVYNNGDDGIHPGSDDINWGFRNQILNNTVYNNSANGIWDRGCSIKSTPQSGRIEGNTCYNNVYGIYIANQSGTIITNNNCYLNGKSGIAITNVSNITITENNCYNNSQTVRWAHGIDVFAKSTSLTITSNQMWDDQAVSTQKDGIGRAK